MPGRTPPGRKQDIAPASRSAQSLGRKVFPSRVTPWMKTSRGGGATVIGTGGFALQRSSAAKERYCASAHAYLLRRNKSPGINPRIKSPLFLNPFRNLDERCS